MPDSIPRLLSNVIGTEGEEGQLLNECASIACPGVQVPVERPTWFVLHAPSSFSKLNIHRWLIN